MDQALRDAERRFRRPGAVAGQLAGLLLAPAAWAVQMAVSYALVPALCRAGTGTLALHVTSLIALAVAVAGLWLAGRNWSAAGRGWRATGHEAVDRTRFLSVTGLLLGSYVTAILLLQAAVSWRIDPCEGLVR